MTALCSAFAPSITTRMARLGLSPRSIRSASSALQAAGVFGGAFPQPQYVLFAVALDADRYQHYMFSEVHPVDHQGDQPNPT
jgi:hypothetical protein